MSNTSKPSLKDIISNYLDSKLYDEISGTWAASLLFRPPGLLLAWLAIRLGVTAMALTMLALCSTLSLAVAATFVGGQLLMKLALVQAAFYLLLDHADGQVARSTLRQSRQGEFLDGISDVIWRIVILAVIGHAFDTMGQSPQNVVGHSGLGFGLAAGAAATVARLVRQMTNSQVPMGQSGRKALPKTAGAIAFSFLSGLDQIAPFLAQVALLAGMPNSFLWVVLAYHLSDLAGAVVASFYALGPEQE